MEIMKMRYWSRYMVLCVAAFIASRPAIAQMHVPPVELADPMPQGLRIDSAGILGNFFPAAGAGPHAAILLLGGSEGGLGNGSARMARALQAAGFSVLQQSYYRGPGQPADFVRIPLETFDRGLAWLAARADIDRRRIGIMGGSKGAEAALVIASRHPELRAVVAGMPSAVVWPAFSWSAGAIAGSSWTFGGTDLPVLPYGKPDYAKGMSAIYQAGLDALPAHPDAAIAIERSRAPVLLVCGRADTLWPSCSMAEMLHRRDPRVTLLAYDDAGHGVFGVPVADDSPALPGLAAMGGTPAGNNAARRDSWPKVVTFLRMALGR